MATPLAAGAGGLLLEIHPTWTPAQLLLAMKSSASRYSHPDNLYGWGIFNTLKASGLFFIDSIQGVVLTVGDSLKLHITTTSIIDSVPRLAVLNPPSGADLIDSGNGAGAFLYQVRASDAGNRPLEFTARVGTGVDTMAVSLLVSSVGTISAGPNPFSDSLVIFMGKAGKPTKISIHAANGEKVWEDFSDNYNSARATVTWHGVNDQGKQVAPGVYFIIVRTDQALEKIKVFKR